MARGQDTGNHPGRSGGREAFTGRKNSYGGIPTTQLDSHMGSGPFHGEGADAYYAGVKDDYQKSNARKSLDHASGTAPFNGELSDKYYAGQADEQGKGHMYPWGRD
jgi:hypothetical protein